jgi:hypothetical protein
LSSIPASYFSVMLKSRPAFRLVAISALMGGIGIQEVVRSGGFPVDELDLALDDFGEGDVGHAHARAGGNQRGAPAVELFDALGDQIDQDEGVGDNFGGLIKEIAFHIRTGKSRNWLNLLKRDDVFREQGRFFFAQNKWIGEVFRI